MKAEIFSCISKDWSTFDEYLTLVSECDLSIREGIMNSGLLHCAVSNKRWVIAEDLIMRGIDVNMQDDKMNTVLHYLAKKPNLDMAKIILDAGGNPNIENMYGLTPVMSVVCNRTRNEEKYDLLKLFIEYGGNPMLKGTNQEHTPLEMAHEFCDERLISILGEE